MIKHLFVWIGLFCTPFIFHAKPLRVGIAGMTHDHVGQVFSTIKKAQQDVVIVGFAEPNKEYALSLLKSQNLPDSLWFPTLEALIAKTKPEAIAAFNSIYEHLEVVKVCAPKGIHVIVEKPLAVNMNHLNQMKALVISNMMSSCPDYGKYADEVLSKQFDKTVLDSLMAMEARNDFANPNYMGLLIPNFYEKHILRLPSAQWPEPVNRSLGKMNQSLYVTMQGPSEFGIAGRLTSWDVSKELKNINLPTLVVGAKHDTMDPEHMKWMASQFKNGTYLYCENGSHMSMYDDQQTYFKGLIGFVHSVEGQN